MVFSRLFFIYIFLPLCLLCYALARGTKAKNTVLIIFSLVFYAWGEPVYIFLMLITAVVNYSAGLLIGKYQGKKGDTAATAAVVVYDLLMLGVFKYSGFIVENINALFSSSIPVPDIKLPIGISFYTFQTISYIIDCHWEKVKPQKSFKNFLLFLTLFPQLVAGPIVRYSTIEKEIEERTITLSDVSYGLNRVALGLGKKVLLANQLSIIADSFLGNIGSSTMLGAWYGVIAYGLQIYFDFSGYSDIAIGLGRVFGFHFDENFKHPFICRDITEFWQRWHISLSTFFRDYVLYIPIFGKRRKYGGLFLVWLCTGIWHGASWNFIIWGLYYGIFVFIEMKIGKKNMKKIPIVIRHIYSKFVIFVGFGIFYFEKLGKLGTFFKTAFGFGKNGFIAVQDKISLMNNMYLMILAVICCFPILSSIKNISDKHYVTKVTVSSAAAIAAALLLIVTSVMLVDATTNPFLYFRF
ncbi:alginate O-acetyltransferase complex protein AlgI [Ruminococcus flavefaciens]|uniref:Alginate O-acetyltransferase complex protein AlgI n=1 Tax=Ruminococcus flavefaciens TaxID=1265 RepID=A0A1H6L0U7_RUMFL|nr:alginate O-acetyltransferase complex protein AlgI [Ruminococcus flavefaciens]